MSLNTNIQIDKIIRSRRRTVALEITDDAKLLVRAPLKSSLKYIEEVIAKNNIWIAKKQFLAKKRNILFKPKQFVAGEKFLYLGQEYPLQIIDVHNDICLEDFLLVPQKLSTNIREHIIAWYKKQAAEVITKRVEYYSGLAGLHHSGIKLSEAKTKWASCNADNSLTFVWRLVMAPLATIDYVVVHELAHIDVKNHSRKFWNKVASIFPGYKKERRWLRENGRALLI
jgi:predicted metal-dependent hydrolase